MAGQRNSYGKRTHPESDYYNGGSKRRNSGPDSRDRFVIDLKDTVYRYLCPVGKIGSIIGRGGEIVKQLRVDTKSKIHIGEALPGCDERVVTLYSSGDETNQYGDSGQYICPSQDALFRVHENVIAEDLRGEDSEGQQVTAKLLVSSDQIGCILGRGGQIVQSIRSETGAQIRILKDRHLPPCALSTDELVQVSGEAAAVRKALHNIASRLHENPSRSQHLLVSAVPIAFSSAGSLIAPTAVAPIVGITPVASSYGAYKGDSGDYSQSLYSAPREDFASREFCLRMVCPSANIGAVIGKSGSIINQIRQDTRATIRVDSSTSEEEDCLITISSKEYFDDQVSPTLEAALRLQPRCSERVERDSGLVDFSTRLLVPSSRIGCLLGKGGAIINEMRRLTKANIRVLGKDNLPKVAAQDDEMVLLSGDLDFAKEALIHISRRLRTNVFDREGTASSYVPTLPYLPVPAGSPDAYNYDSRESRRFGRPDSYSSSYHLNDYATVDSRNGGSQAGGSGGSYGTYGSYSSGRIGSSGFPREPPSSRPKSYY